MLAARSHDREDISDPESRISHYPIQKLGGTGKLVFVADARRDRRYRAAEALEGKRMAVSICVLPVKASGEIRGGIYADHRFHALKRPQENDPRREICLSLAAVALTLLDRVRGAVRAETTGVRDDLEAIEPVARAPALPRESDREERLLQARPDGLQTLHGMLSANPDLRDVFDTVRSLSSASLPILICGETGTGKSLLAKVVHEASVRARGPFVTFLCGAVPEELIESEVLGHLKGAFTGAESDREGIFAAAHRGTLLLDEVADMSPALQKKLLRVLEDGKVRPLGAKEPIQLDVRIVSSTSADLERLVREGQFRRDLYYRLKSAVLEIQPLRNRREDIVPLAVSFLADHAGRAGVPAPQLELSALHRILRHPWPGNVRELENEMRRIVALGRATVRAEDLALGRSGSRDAGSRSRGSLAPAARLSAHVALAESQAIIEALTAAHGNKSRAAASLGITRKSLYRRMARYRIQGGEAPR